MATLHEPGARGAERFLAPVVLEGPRKSGLRRRSPLFQPHWLGSRDPALSPPKTRRDPGRDRSIIATILTVAALLVLVALLLLLLFACQPTQPTPPPPSPSPASPTQSTPSPSPTPLSPSPTRTRSGTPSPSETDSGGGGAGGNA